MDKVGEAVRLWANAFEGSSGVARQRSEKDPTLIRKVLERVGRL